ncbi:hypothetical protein Tco_0084697 [Tanacetum coccineum]
MYHRTEGFTGHEMEVYKSLVFRHFHGGCVIKPDFLETEPNLRNTFEAIGFDCLLDLDEQNFPIFVLQFYKSVRIIRNLNGTISIAFVIDNVETTLTLENFARILKIPGEGVCLYTSEWPISSIIRYSDPLSKHLPSSSRRTVLDLKSFNLAYYIAYQMVSVTQSSDMTLPYAMLLTRLYKHVRTNHPYALSNDFQLVDHVMIPISNKRVFHLRTKGKRPHLPTPTPSDFSSSESPPTNVNQGTSANQGVPNDPVDNYTLDPITYLNQLPPIEGGESPEFKQTKGLFKCLFHYLCKRR